MKLMPFLFILFFISCSDKKELSYPIKEPKEAISADALRVHQKVSEQVLHSIDFRNFTYDWYPTWGKEKAKTQKIILRDGEMGASDSTEWFSFGGVKFADLGKDGKDDAIVLLVIGSGGNGVTNALLIYASEEGKPKLVWGTETGDGANGGLRNAYAQDGQLIIEQYNQDKIVSDGKMMPVPNCCPLTFKRTYYDLAQGKLEKKREETDKNEFDNARSLWKAP